MLSFVKEEVRTELDNKKEILATKEDIADTKEALANAKAQIIKWMFIFLDRPDCSYGWYNINLS